MMRRDKQAGLVLIAALTLSCQAARGEDATGSSNPSNPVGRARETVQMLDDVYKIAIVLITENYVESEDDFAAGSAAITWFDAVKQRGWPSTRLLDASGEPINDENSPQDQFEKDSIAHLKAGNDYYEEIIERDGKRYLRATTPVPVVVQKCTLCHENYKQVKKGEPIGALSYTVEIK